MSSRAWSKAVVLLALLAACPNSSGGYCEIDEDCGGDTLCARDRYCTNPAALREVTVTWTIGGEPASTATCPTDNLQLDFLTPNGLPLSYTPVPCRIGQFFIDKLPLSYTRAAIGTAVGSITSDGTVRIAL